jgi:UPF0755 protein
MTNDIENTREHTKILGDEIINEQQSNQSTSGRKRRYRIKSGAPLLGTLRSIMITLIGTILAVIIILVTLFSLKNNYYDPVDTNDESKVRVEVPMGSSLSSIANLLYEKEIIRNTAVFKVYVDFNDMSSKLKAGTYDFSKDMSMDDIVSILGTGTSNVSVTTFTVTEGMTAEDMATIFLEQGIIDDKEDFLEICKTGIGVETLNFTVLSENGEDIVSLMDDEKEDVKYQLEGYLFPDTYEIFINSAPETIINKMLNQFEQVYSDDFLQRTQELNMTIGDIVTMASIIEREGKPQDFKKISAVFHNRLKADDKLMSCATVQYVIGVRKFQFTREELDTPSPYNTYQVGGLPIAPISNPGRQAIEAALYPDEEYLGEGYYFFCSQDPENGELAFARTNEEHEANVAKYEQLWEVYDRNLE